MGFRFLLVGLVAGLGIDLPARQDLQEWTLAGQSWVSVRLDEWNAWVPVGAILLPPSRPTPKAEATPAVAARAESIATVEVISEEEFTAVVEEVLASFRESDVTVDGKPISAIAPIPAESPNPIKTETVIVIEPAVTAAPAPVQADPLEVGDDLYPGLAYALNFASDGCSEIEHPAPVVAEVSPAKDSAPVLESIPAAVTTASVDDAADAAVSVPVVAPAPLADSAAVADTSAVAESTSVSVADVTGVTDSLADADAQPSDVAASVPVVVPAPVVDHVTAVAEPTSVADAAPIADSLADADAPPFTDVPAADIEAATIADAIDAAPIELASETEEPPALVNVSHARNQRLATAFRLTGEAFLAWSRLFEGPAVVSIRP
jgi:peptidoglycan DL-endopeptidase CwlO